MVGPVPVKSEAAMPTTRSDKQTFGTLAWAASAHGRLTFLEQLGLAARSLAAQLADLPSQTRVRVLRGTASRNGGRSLRPPPDTRLAREAYELARERCSEPLLAHCLRCWLLADLFARRDRIDFDEELLYLACVMHDLGLTDAHRAAPWEPAGCFAVHGALVSSELLCSRGADAGLAERVGDAIALHMNARVPLDEGAEAHLLHAAAHLDVAGSRAGDLEWGETRSVLSAHPRAGFGVHFGQAMRREASEHPRSRAAVLWKLGMPMAITLNPLDRGA
jgi:hypothetical protein